MKNQQTALTLDLDAGRIQERRVGPVPIVRPCPGCGRGVWVAWLDGRLDEIRAEPVTLTLLGEAQALAAGRRTMSHWAGGLDERRAYWIRRIPPSPTNIIRPEHRCGPIPAFDHYPEKRRTRYEHHSTPPF